MTYLIPRNVGLGRGYLAREGDSGAVVWTANRDTQLVGKGPAYATIPATPGQIVFTTGGAAVVPPNTALV